ncbi:MAG: YhcB family protein [Kangiellaceae bacterium]|nr:YhcB family protein [Kangiellaceae bacterium]
MDLLIAFGIIAAGAAGFIFGKKFSGSEVERTKLEQQLSEKTQELNAFHSKVNSHFEKTAELFNHVSDSYQSLYDHMATSSTQLCASQTFQSLPKSSTEQLLADPSSVNNGALESGNSEEVFDATHLYNAHSYRNQQAENDPEEAKLDDPKVVEIASAKEDSATDSDAQALDYAIKKKGVINHNSLDMDGVKSS